MSPSSNEADKLSLSALVALVIGSMVGSGIFALPASFGRAAGVLRKMVAWDIAGAGMLMLAFVFQTLVRRRPDLNAGINTYAKAEGERKEPAFKPLEAVIMAALAIALCAGVYACAVRVISICSLCRSIGGDKMNARTICGLVILGGLMTAALPISSRAQSVGQGASAPKQAATPAPSRATPNTNTNPTKHRYWRHLGGRHPHYGSRRVRT
jgi:amino acid transporter